MQVNYVKNRLTQGEEFSNGGLWAPLVQPDLCDSSTRHLLPSTDAKKNRVQFGFWFIYFYTLTLKQI